MIDPNQRLSRREAQVFGLLLFPAFCVLVGWSLHHRIHASWPLLAAGALGAVEAVGGLVDARIWRGVYRALMYITFPISFVVSNLLLAALYFLLFTPMGLVARILGFDPMQKRFGKQPSYFVAKLPEKGSDRYFKQF